METQTEKQNLPPVILDLVREAELLGGVKEANRIVGLLLKWGIRLTPEQADEILDSRE